MSQSERSKVLTAGVAARIRQLQVAAGTRENPTRVQKVRDARYAAEAEKMKWEIG